MISICRLRLLSRSLASSSSARSSSFQVRSLRQAARQSKGSAMRLLLLSGLLGMHNFTIKANRNMVFRGAESSLMRRIVSVFPELRAQTTKGQNGRVAVIGGSFQFTGAPYYSAISALRVGADLSHIFCSKFSSAAIKSYSPQIIVHPLFVSEEQALCSQIEEEKMLKEWREKLKTWEKAVHSWIIGPGLGRDLYMQKFFPQMVRGLPDNCLVIFDADGIYYLCNHPELFQQLRRFRAILTPNSRELAFLQRIFPINTDHILAQLDKTQDITQLPPDPTLPPFKIIIKGPCDIILSRERSFIVGTLGGKKRCGGLGDILAGVVSACGLWDYDYGLPLASHIVRTATRAAYESQGRGMTAPCVIQELSHTVKRLQALV